MNRLLNLAISDNGFIFDPNTGESFTVNPTGLEILKHLKESRPSLKIASIMSEDYGLPIEELERDVSDFIDHLRAYKLM